MKQKCKIGYTDGTGEWEEILDVDSLKTAEIDIKKIVDWFNSTLKPGEKPRKFISLIAKPKLKVNKKSLEIWYIEPDDYNMDYLYRYLSKEQTNKINIIHKRKMTDEEGTPDIIFIDTSSISSIVMGNFGCSVSLTYQLIDFLKKHRSSLVYICSYVRSLAEDYLDEIKEKLENEDLFIKICDNGYESIAEEIKEII